MNIYIKQSTGYHKHHSEIRCSRLDSTSWS